MKVRYQLALLIALIFLAFSPILAAGLIGGDDDFLFAILKSVDHWDFGAIFFNKIPGAIYYRPLSTITYHFDKIYWHLNPGVMHLENLLLHIANVLVVFFLFRALLCEEERNRSYLPLAAALLFGLHPLTTDAVNWISARGDLVAGFFILLAALAIVQYRLQGRLILLGLATVCFALGMLSKEVSIAFLPGGILLALFIEPPAPLGLPHKNRAVRTQAWWLGLALLCVTSGFLFLRFFTQAKSSGKLGLTRLFILTDPIYSLFVCLRAFAFYIKKIFWPFPLNFAIGEVDPLYELLAIPLLLGGLYLLWKHRPSGALILTGVCLITPSFLLAFNQISWTPYAERYLYLPSAFIISGLLLAVHRSIPAAYAKKILMFLVILVLGAGSATFARTLIWSSNLALWEDTVQKSPTNSVAWNNYGCALYTEGRLNEAKDAFKRASKVTSIDYNPMYDISQAQMLVKLGRLGEAKVIYESVLKRTKNSSTEAREGLIEVLGKLVEQTAAPDQKNILQAELIALKNQKQ